MTSSTARITSARFHALDSLRAWMMLLGIWFHASCSYMTLKISNWPYRDPNTSSFFNIPLLFLHCFRMPLFFLLAGFFARLLRQRLDTGKLLMNRTRRILVPFLVTWPILFIWDNYNSGRNTLLIRTMHLWFLYYLMYMYLGISLMEMLVQRFVAPARREQIKTGFRRLLSSAWRPLIFAIPTSVPLFFMRTGTLDMAPGFLIQPKNFGIYGLFFGFGWMLYPQADLLPGFKRHAWLQVVTAIIILPVNLLSLARMLRTMPNRDTGAHILTVVTGSVMMWLLVFGLTGLFLIYFDYPSAKMRYLSDASYWMYLVHLPLVIWIPRALGPLNLPAIVKFTIVLALTISILLVSYEWFVRYTMIGRVLNGPRERPTRPVEASASVGVGSA